MKRRVTSALYLLITAALCVASFGAGYYIACFEFLKHQTELLGDKIRASIYELYECEGLRTDVTDERSLGDAFVSGQSEAAEKVSSADSSVLDSASAGDGQGSFEDGDNGAEDTAEDEEQSPGGNVLYEARLIGFGTLRGADKYAQKLLLEGIVCRVVERITITSKRKRVSWYQVVAGPLSYEAVHALVVQLRDRDKLTNVVVAECEYKSSLEEMKDERENAGEQERF